MFHTNDLVEDILTDLRGKGLCGRYALILCDIDGPLLDCSHRLPYLKNKEYDKFYGACMAEDELSIINAPSTLALIAGLISIYGMNKTEMVFCTGRPKRTHALTRLALKDKFPALMRWVEDSKPITHSRERFLHRSDDDYRPAGKVKVDNAVAFLKEHRAVSDRFNPASITVFVIDDDQAVLDEFRTTFDRKMSETANESGLYDLELLAGPSLIKIGDKVSSFEQNKSLAE